MKNKESFNCNACDVYFINDECITIYVNLNGWDNLKKAYQDIEYFATGDNDPMGEEIELRLEEMGVELIYPGKVDELGTTIDFKYKNL